VIATSDAAGVVSQMGPIVITGQVLGDPGNPDSHYGFVAQHVFSLTVGGTTVRLKAGPDNDHIVVPEAPGDMSVNDPGQGRAGLLPWQQRISRTTDAGWFALVAGLVALHCQEALDLVVLDALATLLPGYAETSAQKPTSSWR
jgi:hypothetical protein